MEETTRLLSVMRALLRLLKGHMEELGVNAVTDCVAKMQEYPYIVLGRVSTEDDGTKTAYGERITINIELWTKNNGRAKDLMTIKKLQSILCEGLNPISGDEPFTPVSYDLNKIFSEELDYGVFLTTLIYEIRIV